uniref:UPAR/Ly6 domain-containing protein n=1 Tax=Megaselia scalaris TaxID=36166 RepID=T1GGN2_MEGSC
MVQIYGILLALVAGLVACNALTCWTCLDDECIDGKLFVLCSRTKVQESHDHISAIYGQVPTNPPLIIRNYDCVEMDTLLVYRNNSERYSSYKGCLERGSSILNISHNAAVYYNETRKYLSSCTDDFCNSKEIFRPFPNITTPSVNNTTPTINVTTPSINITTPSLNITTPSINITTPSLNITTLP